MRKLKSVLIRSIRVIRSPIIVALEFDAQHQNPKNIIAAKHKVRSNLPHFYKIQPAKVPSAVATSKNHPPPQSASEPPSLPAFPASQFQSLWKLK